MPWQILENRFALSPSVFRFRDEEGAVVAQHPQVAGLSTLNRGPVETYSRRVSGLATPRNISLPSSRRPRRRNSVTQTLLSMFRRWKQRVSEIIPDNSVWFLRHRSSSLLERERRNVSQLPGLRRTVRQSSPYGDRRGELKGKE